MAVRKDIHRKSEIVPQDYDHVMFYNLATRHEGWNIPPFNVDRVIALRKNGAKFAEHGGLGQCTVCGSQMVYGEVWVHRTTQEHIYVGHICAQKYGLLADYGAFQQEYEEFRNRTAKRLMREMMDEKKKNFLADAGNLKEAFEKGTHDIIQNIKSQFDKNAYISGAQVALVLKLYKEQLNPKPEEKKVPAPEGRIDFVGEVVGTKWAENYYNGVETPKMTIKVTTEKGVWLCWGTVPNSILDAIGPLTDLRGKQVDVKATLTQSDRDTSFAFFKRPVGRLLAS